MLTVNNQRQSEEVKHVSRKGNRLRRHCRQTLELDKRRELISSKQSKAEQNKLSSRFWVKRKAGTFRHSQAVTELKETIKASETQLRAVEENTTPSWPACPDAG